MEEDNEPVPPAEAREELQDDELEQQVPPETNDEVQEQREQDQHQDPQEVHDEVQEQVQQQVPQDLNDEIQEQDQRQVPAGMNDEIQQQQQQEQEEQAPFPPEFVYHQPSRVEFHIREIMGRSDNGVITVYKAACAFREGTERKLHSEVLAFLKLARPVGSQGLNILSEQLRRGLQLPRYNYPHRNLVGTECHFRDNGICCVVFSYMDGSLRSILRSKLHNGIRQEYVVMILKEALKGLCCIHDNNLVHGEISAGQIFYELTTVKLSFAATVYDHGIDDDDDPAYLPVKSISTWASAPEVYNSQDAGLNDPKTDIWMIGITALELTFGEAQIRNRGHLMSIVNKITREHRLLPLRDNPFPLPWRLFLSVCEPFMDKSINSFEKFVCKCLATDPKTRPTARELLQSELFTKMTSDRNALREIFT